MTFYGVVWLLCAVVVFNVVSPISAKPLRIQPKVLRELVKEIPVPPKCETIGDNVLQYGILDYFGIQLEAYCWQKSRFVLFPFKRTRRGTRDMFTVILGSLDVISEIETEFTEDEEIIVGKTESKTLELFQKKSGPWNRISTTPSYSKSPSIRLINSGSTFLDPLKNVLSSIAQLFETFCTVTPSEKAHKLMLSFNVLKIALELSCSSKTVDIDVLDAVSFNIAKERVHLRYQFEKMEYEKRVSQATDGSVKEWDAITDLDLSTCEISLFADGSFNLVHTTEFKNMLFRVGDFEDDLTQLWMEISWNVRKMIVIVPPPEKGTPKADMTGNIKIGEDVLLNAWPTTERVNSVVLDQKMPHLIAFEVGKSKVKRFFYKDAISDDTGAPDSSFKQSLIQGFVERSSNKADSTVMYLEMDNVKKLFKDSKRIRESLKQDSRELAPIMFVYDGFVLETIYHKKGDIFSIQNVVVLRQRQNGNSGSVEAVKDELEFVCYSGRRWKEEEGLFTSLEDSLNDIVAVRLESYLEMRKRHGKYKREIISSRKHPWFIEIILEEEEELPHDPQLKITVKAINYELTKRLPQESEICKGARASCPARFVIFDFDGVELNGYCRNQRERYLAGRVTYQNLREQDMAMIDFSRDAVITPRHQTSEGKRLSTAEPLNPFRISYLKKTFFPLLKTWLDSIASLFGMFCKYGSYEEMTFHIEINDAIISPVFKCKINDVVLSKNSERTSGMESEVLFGDTPMILWYDRKERIFKWSLPHRKDVITEEKNYLSAWLYIGYLDGTKSPNREDDDRYNENPRFLLTDFRDDFKYLWRKITDKSEKKGTREKLLTPGVTGDLRGTIKLDNTVLMDTKYSRKKREKEHFEKHAMAIKGHIQRSSDHESKKDNNQENKINEAYFHRTDFMSEEGGESNEEKTYVQETDDKEYAKYGFSKSKTRASFISQYVGMEDIRNLLRETAYEIEDWFKYTSAVPTWYGLALVQFKYKQKHILTGVFDRETASFGLRKFTVLRWSNNQGNEAKKQSYDVVYRSESRSFVSEDGDLRKAFQVFLEPEEEAKERDEVKETIDNLKRIFIPLPHEISITWTVDIYFPLNHQEI